MCFHSLSMIRLFLLYLSNRRNEIISSKDARFKAISLDSLNSGVLKELSKEFTSQFLLIFTKSQNIKCLKMVDKWSSCTNTWEGQPVPTSVTILIILTSTSSKRIKRLVWNLTDNRIKENSIMNTRQCEMLYGKYCSLKKLEFILWDFLDKCNCVNVIKFYRVFELVPHNVLI